MSGIRNLQTLLASLQPVLSPVEFVFVTQAGGRYCDGANLNPIATFQESEGLTLVVPKENADLAFEHYTGVLRMISLQVHSDLGAVGLTAAVADALSKRDISANLVAAYYHDHVFVPVAKANDALNALQELMKSSGLDTKQQLK